MVICFLNETICISFWGLLGVVIFVAAAGLGVALLIRRLQDHAMSTITVSETSYVSPNDNDERDPEENELRFSVGQRIFYDRSGGVECHLFVKESNGDEGEITGDFQIVLPTGARVDKIDYNRDDPSITIDYSLGSDRIQLRFNVEDPEEVGWYDVFIDRVVVSVS